MSAFVQNEKNGLIYMTSPVIVAKHAFSTRFGGVSEDGLASLNLGFNRGDVRERVIENYRLLGAALGLDVMRGRVAAVGGTLSVDSSPGQGTRVTAVFRDADTTDRRGEHGR